MSVDAKQVLKNLCDPVFVRAAFAALNPAFANMIAIQKKKRSPVKLEMEASSPMYPGIERDNSVRDAIDDTFDRFTIDDHGLVEQNNTERDVLVEAPPQPTTSRTASKCDTNGLDDAIQQRIPCPCHNMEGILLSVNKRYANFKKDDQLDFQNKLLQLVQEFEDR